jgi:hypothetical protein
VHRRNANIFDSSTLYFINTPAVLKNVAINPQLFEEHKKTAKRVNFDVYLNFACGFLLLENKKKIVLKSIKKQR